MGDDDRTPPRRARPGRLQTSDDRDADGLRARQERIDRDRERARRDQVDELADAVAMDGAVTQELSWEDGITKPQDLRELGPLTPREMELWENLARFKAEVRRSKKDTGDRILEAMGNRPPAERLAKLEARLKVLFVILGAIGTLALGEVITIAKGLYERGQTDGAHEIRLEQVERATERNSQRLDRIDVLDGRRRSDSPDHPALFFQPRTTTP